MCAKEGAAREELAKGLLARHATTTWVATGVAIVRGELVGGVMMR